MSQDRLCLFWCLLQLDRDEEPEEAFDVEADLEWEVGQLTAAIKEKKNCLRGYETSDLILWKVRPSYIPVETLSSSLTFTARQAHPSRS